MKKILSFSFLLVLCASVFSQSVTLTFTGRDANNHRVQLNRVVITNLTKGWQETIYWPDTTLTMQNGTGIDDYANNGGIGLMQNNPNPFNGTTDINLTVADAGSVTLEIMDVNGRIVETQNFASLQAGINTFRITLSAAGTYLMTARQNGKTSSVKMVNNGGGNGDGIEYTGIVRANDYSPQQPQSGTRGNTTNPFTFGDQMEYVGYATINGTEAESNRITQQQGSSQTFVLQFNVAQGPTDGQPCLGTSTVTDIDGNVYNTVWLGSQCWMKNNLRTTRYADNTGIPAGSMTSLTEPYRYAPDDNESNVPTYGYLYNWAAVMHGAVSSDANPSGVQGICPTGWHMPSDAEWTQLTEYVGSRSEYVCGDDPLYISKALSSTTGWLYSSTNTCAVSNTPSNNNATGFSIIPAGYCSDTYDYIGLGLYAFFWSITELFNDEMAWIRQINHSSADVVRCGSYKLKGCSVRCLRD